MQQTPITERLNYPNELETQQRGLTPKTGILIVIGILTVIWPLLGGVTMDTTLSIVIKIPAWLMLVFGFGIVVAAVFIGRYMRDALCDASK